MKKRRILSFFAVVAVVVLCLAGCQSDADTDTSDFHYITDWSLNEIVQNIEMNGKLYSMPFSVEQLGEEYSIGEKVSLTSESYGYNLYYNNEYFALINLDTDEVDINKSLITSLSFGENSNYKIGEFYNGNKKKNVKKTYGNPSIESDIGNLSSYTFENGDGITVLYENNKVSGIVIRYHN